LNGFQDWRKLAHSADFLVVMALDQSYRTPGPMVSVPWLKQLLAYARQTMPDMLARIVWELPLYGASWHMQGGGWVFEGGIDYVEAQKRVEQVPDGSIDAKNSDLKDAASAHLVYTDAGGVKRALWYHTAQNLYNIVLGFHQALDQVPELKDKHMQIAMWYRQTSEPGAVWDLIAPLLPNE
ncbi:MAG: hypothetical protein J2P37_22625, partial [Ktedonobacteraceae bacterium]|nr:hypothetical protein [Ktedonobacteraceae bacterium]